MQIATGIVVFFMIWWIVLLLVLPFNFKSQQACDKGLAKSAPQNFSFKKKALYTTLITVVLFIALYIIIAADVFSFRALVRQQPLW